MSVRFILGRSGTGKTSYCIKSIVEQLQNAQESQSLIFLVPEQASYQAERAILSSPDLAGYSRLNVLSFDRLGFLLTGKNAARKRIGRVGQQMIIQRVLRQNKDKLKLFNRSADRPGMGQRLAETISEFGRYAKTSEDIEILAERLDKEAGSVSAMKLADIGLVFREYLKFIEGKFIDPDFQLERLRRLVGQADFIKGAKVWVDGFSGFSDGELAILTEILKAAQETSIALCLDPAQIDIKKPTAADVDPASMFYPTHRTFLGLLEIIGKCKLQRAEPVVLKEAVRFLNCSELGHIERQIFETKSKRKTVSDNVRIVSAPDERMEVRFVARQIQKLIREENYRYRDIAVIASDIERYEHYINASFEEYEIPFFIDKQKALGGHQPAEFVRSVLKLVTECFSHSNVFAYLKSSLVPIKSRDVDLLENYCLGFGVDDNDWVCKSDWCFDKKDEPTFDEEKINKIRREVVGPLVELRGRVKVSQGSHELISAEVFTQAVFDFLDKLKIAETIGKWIENAKEDGDLSLADEHRQFYGGMVSVFDELVEVFDGVQMSCSDFAAVLDSAFWQVRLGFIPPGLDQVLVGSIERSRHPNLKAVFLVGATQKQFPAPLVQSSILTDIDRNVAEKAGFSLGPSTGESLAERQYLAYIAFTRASEFLYVSYPATDQKGRATVRSVFVAELEELFDGLKEESTSDEQIGFENIYSQSEFADLLCHKVTGKNHPRKLLDEICGDQQLGEAGAIVKRAMEYDNKAKLDEQVREELFGRQLKSSATGLGTFAECPYKYFVRHILRLKEREEFKLRPLDIGNFYHRVLESWLKKLTYLKINFDSVSDERLIGVLNEQMAQVLQSDSFISSFAGHNRHNRFIIDSAGEILEEFVVGAAKIIRAGRFRPADCEIWFGDSGEFELGLSNGRSLVLRGRVDRLDVFDTGGEKIAVVYDYKRLGRSFSWSNFYHGLDVQLPVYMLAIENTKKADKVVGAFYLPIEVGIEKIAIRSLGERSRGFDYQAKGVFNGENFQQLDGLIDSGWSQFYNFRVSSKDGQYGDYGRSGALRPSDFEKVLHFSERKVIELAERIICGEIEVRPYKLGSKRACQYCQYKAVCRFDWLVNDYNELESADKKKVLEEIGGGDG